jgi:dihydrofolate reductase
MRKLIVSTFMTLDGVMQAPGGPEEDPDGDFEHGGWAFGYWDEVVDEAMHAAMAKPFDLLLGRKTYEIFAAHWAHSDEPAAGPLNAATKYVASRTLESVEWQNSQLLEGPLAEAVNAVKAQDGPNIQVQGSANLVQSLHADGLVDELNVWTFPVVLGKGKRLFEPGIPAGGLEVIDTKVSPSGVIMTRYRTGAGIKGGSFADAELDRRAAQAG